MARGRPGTVRTPPIILFSLPLGVRLSSSPKPRVLPLFPRALYFLPRRRRRRRLLRLSFSLSLSLPPLSSSSSSSSYSAVRSSSSSLLSSPLSVEFLWHSVRNTHSACTERVRLSCWKRQPTIGAIHGLLARINCRRKLLRLCSQVETWWRHVTPLEPSSCPLTGGGKCAPSPSVLLGVVMLKNIGIAEWVVDLEVWINHVAFKRFNYDGILRCTVE